MDKRFKNNVKVISTHFDQNLMGFFVATLTYSIAYNRLIFSAEKKFYRAYWDLAYYVGKYCNCVAFKDKYIEPLDNNVKPALVFVGDYQLIEVANDHFRRCYQYVEAYVNRQKSKHRDYTKALRKRARKRNLPVVTLNFQKASVTQRIECINYIICLLKDLLEKKRKMPNYIDLVDYDKAVREYIKYIPGKSVKQKIYEPK